VKDDRVYLRHILECLDAIRVYVADGRDAFFEDRTRPSHSLSGS